MHELAITEGIIRLISAEARGEPPDALVVVAVHRQRRAADGSREARAGFYRHFVRRGSRRVIGQRPYAVAANTDAGPMIFGSGGWCRYLLY